MNMKTSGLACIYALVFATPAFAVGYSTGHGGGGDLQGAESIAAQYNNSGEQFRIRGRCLSSCTVFLSIRNVCIEPSARLGFHAGPTMISTARMEAAYNQKLRSHLGSVGAMQSRNYYFLSAGDLTARFGYKACPRN